MHSDPIAVALSGGGIRAMVFHLGVLRYLAEQGRLEQVSKISTVSGGSLLVGMIFQNHQMNWPDSGTFLHDTHPSIREVLCSRSMILSAVRQLRDPRNCRYLLSRSNLLAEGLKNEWGIKGQLNELPVKPEWSINGTTAESGKRFRFKKDTLGDYTLGYAKPERLPLAFAMAVSAAFPVGFGPLVLDMAQFVWKKRDGWGEPVSNARKVAPETPKIHLYDGGVYDNLGLEPFFDAGKAVPKNEEAFILASDAGAPLQTGFHRLSINPFRLKRLADIMSDQTRALRVRTFQSYVLNNPDSGVFLTMLPGNGPGQDEGSNSQFAASFPTTLRKLQSWEFDAIEDHGYQVAEKHFLIRAPMVK